MAFHRSSRVTKFFTSFTHFLVTFDYLTDHNIKHESIEING